MKFTKKQGKDKLYTKQFRAEWKYPNLTIHFHDTDGNIVETVTGKPGGKAKAIQALNSIKGMWKNKAKEQLGPDYEVED